MKKVLIITHWFPPLNMIASKRFGIMCGYFEKYGYEPYILTANAHKIASHGFSLDLKCPVDEGKIVRIGQMGKLYEPESLPLRLLSRVLELVGIYLNTLMPAVVERYQKAKKEINVKAFCDIDVIIATYPDIDSIYMANYLSKKLKCPYIADIRDLVDFSDGISSGCRHNIKLDLLIEKLLLRNAAAIVPVTAGYGRILRKRYPGKKIKVVYNGWENAAQVSGTKCSDVAPKCKYLYYAGIMYEHRLESLMLLAECVKEANKREHIEFIIRSTGPENNNKKMKRMLREKELEGIVKVLPPEKETEVRLEQMSAYINIVLSTIHPDNEELMATIPGKVFELLPFKSPVLAIVPEESDVSKLLKKTNKGIGTTDRTRIIDFILECKNGFNGNEKILSFSREKQAERYCKIMDGILAER